VIIPLGVAVISDHSARSGGNFSPHPSAITSFHAFLSLTRQKWGCRMVSRVHAAIARRRASDHAGAEALVRSAAADDEYLDTKALAARMGFSTSFFAKLRWIGGGPPFVKFGGAVRYRWADVQKWTNERVRTSTSDSRPHAAV
jgi:predicted DNA-binding transcriptional regulator AlpA